MSIAENVREFNLAAGQSCPDKPSEPMTQSEVHFVAKMILDEVMELMATVDEPGEAKATLQHMIACSKDISKSPTPSLAEQADAFVDIEYYMHNAACKKGVNLSRVFDLVHEANMAKRDSQTGVFLKNAEGKVIKPKGWVAPDIESEIERQRTNGSWVANHTLL
jgi:predicted HAD superfamily Cof-like phosphohydrolase